MSIENIINNAWENKDQVNPNSDKRLKILLIKSLQIQIVEKLELQKRLMENG